MAGLILWMISDSLFVSEVQHCYLVTIPSGSALMSLIRGERKKNLPALAPEHSLRDCVSLMHHLWDDVFLCSLSISNQHSVSLLLLYLIVSPLPHSSHQESKLIIHYLIIRSCFLISEYYSLYRFPTLTPIFPLCGTG